MKKLYKLVIKSYIGPFIITFCIAIFVLLMQFVWKYVDELVGKGIEWYVIAELLTYTSASLVPLALPLAVLLSSLMTFGNLGENFELVAFKTSGVSLQKIMFPLIVVSVFISICAFLFSNYVLPVANLKMGTLLYDIREQKPAINIKEGIFYNGIDGYSIRVNKKDDKTDQLYDILIYDHTSYAGNMKVVTAKKGVMRRSEDERYLILTLHDGYIYEEDIRSHPSMARQIRPHYRVKFKEEKIRFDLSEFRLQRTKEDFFKDHYSMLNLSQLKTTADSIRHTIIKRKQDIIKYLYNQYYFFSSEYMAEAKGARGRASFHHPFGRPLADTTQNNLEFIRSSDLMPSRMTGQIKDKRADELKNEQVKDPLELLSELDKKERLAIIEFAMNMTRGSKSYVSSITEDISMRKRLIARHEIEWQKKFTLSFACLILFFIGAPLGAIIRKGGLGMPVIVSTLIFILFHILSIIGEKFVRECILPAYLGMWIASSILLPFGIFLTYKAATDSVLMDIEFYARIFKPFTKIFSTLSPLVKREPETR